MKISLSPKPTRKGVSVSKFVLSKKWPRDLLKSFRNKTLVENFNEGDLDCSEDSRLASLVTRLNHERASTFTGSNILVKATIWSAICECLSKRLGGVLYAITVNIGRVLPTRIKNSVRGAAAEAARMLREVARKVLGRNIDYVVCLECSPNRMFHLHCLIPLRKGEEKCLANVMSKRLFGEWGAGARYKVHIQKATAPHTWITYAAKSSRYTLRSLMEHDVSATGVIATSRALTVEAPKMFATIMKGAKDHAW